MKIKFSEYKISLLTQLFGVSPDTVRLYEKKGLLKPKKKDSLYRVFSRSDFFDMEYILRLKKMGFSLNEILKILTEADNGELEVLLEKRLSEIAEKESILKESRRETESLLSIVSEVGDASEKLEVVSDVILACCDISDSCELARTKLEMLGITEPARLTAVIGNILDDDIANVDTRQEMELIYTIIDRNGILESEGSGTYEADGEYPGIVIYPKADYIRSITKTPAGKSDQDLKILERFLNENQLEIKGTAYSRCIMGQKIHDESRDYYETWIPLKKK